MKKQLFTILLACITLISIKGFSQGAGIYIYSADQTKLPGAITASGVHMGETKIESFTRSLENEILIGGATGGSGAGKAVSNGITLFKQYSRPSIYLKNLLFIGDHLTKLEIRYYNSADVMYYKLTLGTVFVKDFIELGEGCPAGCPGISEEIKLVFGTMKEEDMLTNVSRCWSFINNNNSCP